MSPSDIKSLFELIRYPLIRTIDLIEGVHPTNMTDPDLYKATLEYHDTGRYDGPQEQIKMRKFNFDFDPVDGLVIDHSATGTLITKSQLPAGKCASGVFIHPEDKSIFYTFYLKACTNKLEGKLFLAYEDFSSYEYLDFDEIPLGETMRGNIDVDDGHIDLLVGTVLLIMSIPLKKSLTTHVNAVLLFYCTMRVIKSTFVGHNSLYITKYKK